MVNWLKQESAFFAWGPALIWGAVILVFSLLPGRLTPTITINHIDKVAHFFEFAVLSVLIVRASHRIRVTPFVKIFLFALILSSVYGIVMELAQRFVPGRVACVYDIYANISGTVFGIILGGFWIWRK